MSQTPRGGAGQTELTIQSIAESGGLLAKKQLSVAGVAGVLVGILALGEGLPSSRSLGAARLLSWLLLIVGVSALAQGHGALGIANTKI